MIVLHILGGDFDLSRLFCRALASRGVAALFMKMPYYGERRQPGSPARMVSVDPEETVRGMTQAVLDIRQAAAWLAAHEEVDADAVGHHGHQPGRHHRRAGGKHRTAIPQGVPDPGRRRDGRSRLDVGGSSRHCGKFWVDSGRTKEELFAPLRPVDPVTYARPLPGRRILMLNARHDEVVPRACTEALWHAFGEPPIIWWNAGHYSAARYMFDGVAQAVKFFQPDVAASDTTHAPAVDSKTTGAAAQSTAK